jgi:hypothetical protein
MGFLRKPTRRETVLLVLVAVGLPVAGIRLLSRADAVSPARAAANAAALPDVPRIGLDRLDAPPSAEEAGRRSLFEFGRERVEERAPEPPRIVVATPPPAPVIPPGMTVAADGSLTPSLPPLNVRYIGSVENSHGVKVAVLVTDRREVLTGQAGQVVANRYRIARIGLESVDLEDVSSGQSRRVPLKGD